jgi:hypothetical protein
MSRAKRESLTKKERAAAVRAKRKHDPNPERKGDPINVSNFGKGKISESYSLSDSSAINLLLLGTDIDEQNLYYNGENDNYDFSEETKRVKLMRDKAGKIRTFMLRRAAAKEAHTHNGVVMKYKNGYVIKLHEENDDDRISEESIRETKKPASGEKHLDVLIQVEERKFSTKELQNLPADKNTQVAPESKPHQPKPAAKAKSHYNKSGNGRRRKKPTTPTAQVLTKAPKSTKSTKA